MRPYLNQNSLTRMARRHSAQIQASAFRSRILTQLASYLACIISELEQKHQSSETLIELEKNLEAIESALLHQCVTTPFNEILTIPRRLPEDLILRLQKIITDVKKLKSNLRLAYSKAA
ncbi:MAG: hypothetical protein A3G32_05425 [Deltaproteobacteria bacterium RIFCSPLOWO2_12_FULL_40_28]|nr:MAG: hypothetical protein A3C45_09535 [Deltaproteobacteria bacterium RIFCSPHIGHO2_02_FULL_40_28]OGQ18770.1 MAG: hypothetical protein A3E27_00240 [Deltaproteobacteria bacterium RIFCSPHIGHO2_12_FULL_40_32]OGQ41071.1 MAG: hypothetical protein A3I69_04145 [Deltaproteobacteria bacterium RIFCSPLOWO2_02_FULL_40_36]OGQ54187.1 MAG: hypothetical protein A3G32_05425 [Deltaproteobacteria bacterium RIFCSPLOWO2_12_FULL_40_28]